MTLDTAEALVDSLNKGEHLVYTLQSNRQYSYVVGRYNTGDYYIVSFGPTGPVQELDREDSAHNTAWALKDGIRMVLDASDN